MGTNVVRSIEKLKKEMSKDPILHPLIWDEDFYVNLSHSCHAIGALLLQKGEDGRMQPVC